jgi:hypothetical protein
MERNQEYNEYQEYQDNQKDMLTMFERNLDDQKHTFTNGITNLHYNINEVQSNVETLKQ